MRPRKLARPAAAGALCFASPAPAPKLRLAQTDDVPRRADRAEPRSKPQIAVRQRKLDVRAGGRTAVAGTVSAAPSRRPGRLAAGQARPSLAPIDRDRTDAAGRYRAARAPPTHRQHARARPRRRRAGRAFRRSARIGRLNVYRDAHASWYGPGLYGNQLGCGGTLHAGPARRRPQVAALRHDGHAQARRALRARARHRPRPVRRRPRVRPHRRHRRSGSASAATARSWRRADGQRRLQRQRELPASSPVGRSASGSSNAATRTPSSRTGRGGA